MAEDDAKLAAWRTTPIRSTTDVDTTLAYFAQGEAKQATAHIKTLVSHNDKPLLLYLAGHLQSVLMVLEENPTDQNAIVIINCAVQDTAHVAPAIACGVFKTLHRVFERWPADAPKQAINHVSVTAKCSVAEHSEMHMCEAGLHLDLLKECQLSGATAQSAFQALGNIAFALPCKPVLLEAGAVQVAFSLFKTKAHTDPVYQKVFNFLRSMSLHPPALPLLLQNGIIEVLKGKLLPREAGGELPKPDKDLFWFISNLSDTREGTMAMLEAGFLTPMCRYLGDGLPKAEGTQEYHENIIKAFYRMSKIKEVQEALLDGGVVDLLREESKRSPNTALMGIALLVGKQDEGKYAGIINADKKILDSIIANMRAAVQNHLSGQAAFVKQPISVVDYFEAIQAISISDVNKAQFCNATTLDLIVNFIHQCSKDLTIVAAGMSVLLELTFAQAAVAHFAANKSHVYKLLEEACAPHKSNAALTKTLADFKFRVEPEEKKKEQSIQRRLSKVGTSASTANEKVVFFSYNWAHQKEIVKLAGDIKAAGYKVWLDIDQMHGSTVEAMADGLDNASIVIVDISPQYKESPNCRLEGMYAMQRRLPLVPVMFEDRYTPTGWLGLLLGTSLWYKYTEEKMHASVLSSVLRELNLKIGPPNTHIASAPGGPPASSAPPPPPPPAKQTLRDMTIKEVGEWLQKIGLEMYIPLLADNAIDGASLQWLIRKDEQGLDALNLINKLGILVPGHAFRFLEMARALK